MTIENETVVDPDLNTVQSSLKRDIFMTLNCAKIGTVTKVDPARRTVQVQVAFKRVLAGGEERSYPLLIDVPFVTIQGGGAAVQVPISPGDECLLIFSDRNIDAWFEEGGEAVPFDGRTHDASDAIAIVGVNNLTSSLPANPTAEARIIAGLARVGVLKDGTEAFVRYSDTRVYADSVGSHMVQGDAQVDVQGGKVGIKGTGGTLLAALEGLIDVLKALTSQDPVSGPIPLTAASIAALEAQKAVLEGVLNS